MTGGKPAAGGPISILGRACRFGQNFGAVAVHVLSAYVRGTGELAPPPRNRTAISTVCGRRPSLADDAVTGSASGPRGIRSAPDRRMWAGRDCSLSSLGVASPSKAELTSFGALA